MKKTNKYIFTITRIGIRPATWEDNHGMSYLGRGQKEVKEIEERIFEREFEIKEEKVVDILQALLK